MIHLFQGVTYNLALKRIEWYAKKKNDRNFDYKQYDFLFNPDINKFDVIAFFLLCQAVGVKYGPNSRESRVLVESQGKLIENRLGKLSKIERNGLVTNILNSLFKFCTYQMDNFFKENLISSKKLKNMHELVLDEGEIILGYG